MKGIIFIAHGSKKQSSNDDFLSLIEDVCLSIDNFDYKAAAFLELANPSIEEISEKFIQQGVKEIYFYPYFLNPGKHLLIDIPSIIQNLQNQNKHVVFKQLPHFGASTKIKKIFLEDLSLL